MSQCIHEGKLYESVLKGPFLTWQPVVTQPITGEPHTACRAEAMMPLATWHKALAFMDWGYRTHKSEVLAIFLFNIKTNEWDVWAPPQTLNGMTVSGRNGKEWDEQRKRWKGDWIQMGSIHHHCAAGAFASGVDQKDEEKRDGFHVTVGNMDKEWEDRSWHVRATVKGVTLPSKLNYFIAVPEDVLAMVPPSIRNAVKTCFLTCTQTEDFPEEWRSNCTQGKQKEGKRMMAAYLGDLLPNLEMEEETGRMPSALFHGQQTVGRFAEYENENELLDCIVTTERVDEAMLAIRNEACPGKMPEIRLIQECFMWGIKNDAKPEVYKALETLPMWALLDEDFLDLNEWELTRGQRALRVAFYDGLRKMIRKAKPTTIKGGRQRYVLGELEFDLDPDDEPEMEIPQLFKQYLFTFLSCPVN